MKESILNSHKNPYQDLYAHNAAWYHAATIAERTPAPTTHSPAIAEQEYANKQLQRWKGHPPFTDPAYFTQRLALDHLTEEDLSYILTEPVAEVQKRLGSLPWVQELCTSLHELYNAQSPVPLPFSKLPETMKNALLQPVVLPLVARGLARLRTRLQQLQQDYPAVPFETEATLLMLIPYLAQHLLARLTRTLVLELNVARVRGDLQGETPEERYQYFFQRLYQPEKMMELLEEYPVLARLMVETLELWLASGSELLERLCIDWTEICAHFPQAHDAGMLTEILADKGDPHRGNRSVTILVWQSGFRLVYKPRPMAVDLHFQEVLAWFNQQGYQPAFRTMRILDRGTYGWCEFVSVDSCSQPDEVERFYQRQGGYLALLYALEATDFHCDNLIATGEHPILIDVEALFQPRVRPSGDMQEYPGVEAMRHSVLRIGFLPQRLGAINGHAGTDISGLGGEAGQALPVAGAQLTGIGTDEMSLDQKHEMLPQGNHRPTLCQQEVNPQEYGESVVAGFSRAYHLLQAQRDTFIATVLPRFENDEIRFVLRPTAFYTTLQQESFHPNVLRDALERERLLNRLWLGMDNLPHLNEVISAERTDLLIGDIPVFTTTPASCHLQSTYDHQITDFFAQPAMTMVKKLIHQLSEQDLKRQCWIIRASFACMPLGTERVKRKSIELQSSQSDVSYQRLLAAARAVGDHLEQHAIYHDDMAGWLTVTDVRENDWQLVPTDADLYNGTAGIALFLGYLGHLTHEQRYTRLARAALQTMRRQIQYQRKINVQGTIGAFNNLGSSIYVLSHLGQLWHNTQLFQEALDTIQYIPTLIAQDKYFDVTSGTAGCIATLLSLHVVAPSPEIVALARQCGDYLLQFAQPQIKGIGWARKESQDAKKENPALAGFSHGNAGIALSLLRLFKIYGDARFRDAALAAMEYERHLFSPTMRNWPDIRPFSMEVAKYLREKEGKQQTENPEEDYFYMTAWCHGAPGIGLARLASLDVIHDDAIHEEIKTALATTIEQGFGMNHCLCHGDMGNLDLLLTASRLERYAYCKNDIARLVPMLLDSIDRQGWITGAADGVETPGLMAGTTGIGYGLLRIAAPELVPSVLVLAPPPIAARM
ncbi:MAG TPA: type 2 lanthipeptide synthetase LanM family protein [Dictyobacter sp.]|jgi:type 2 lantibiotic biosynthesis protein LanM|nr:type 2 lanthipeptide synthetase LanM family protein [Dictyobacter sp.]